jgi:hypothetical protein
MVTIWTADSCTHKLVHLFQLGPARRNVGRLRLDLGGTDASANYGVGLGNLALDETNILLSLLFYEPAGGLSLD